MDVLRYKHATPSPAMLAGMRVLLRPLAQAELEELEQGVAPIQNSEARSVELAIRTLAQSADAHETTIREGLSSDELVSAYQRWAEIQSASTPDIGKLSDQLRKLVNRDPAVIFDGLMATQVSIVEFYGMPVSRLTAGQQAYFTIVGSAYQEFHTPDHSGKMKEPTREWINSETA